MNRPIPAFYCVYLLRSKPSPLTSLYIGSTPNPSRRLRQHNGGTSGGAKRTQRSKQRPWKICLIVTGFPSKIAALQFEWAWQHPWRTRHIDRSELPQDKLNKDYSRKRLRECVHYLHMLLEHNTFRRWPLHLRFFSFDAHQEWQNYLTQRPASLNVTTKLVSNDAAFLTKSKVPRKAQKQSPSSKEHIPESEVQPSIEAIDATYRPYKALIEKSTAVSAKATDCYICKITLNHDTDHILACSCDCSMASHLMCLSSLFLKEERALNTLIPILGKCPSCGETLTWSELVKDLSLRMRGQNYVKKLLRKPIVKRGKNAIADPQDKPSLDLEDPPSSEAEGSLDLEFLDPGIHRSCREPKGKLQQTENATRHAESSANRKDPSLSSKRIAPRTFSPLVAIMDSDVDDEELISD